MLIGIDASRANLKHKTGTEWYSFYLIKNLAKIDHENKYILYLNTEASPELKKAVSSNPNFSFKILNWPLHSFWTLGRLSLEMIFKAPDILFVPAHGLPFFSPRHSVNTIHDLAFLRDKNLYRRDKIKTPNLYYRKSVNFLVKIFTLGKYQASSLDYLYWSTKFALKRASKIIAVSNFTKQEIENFYPKAKSKKIRVIYNGYNSDLYNLGGAKVDEREGLKDLKVDEKEGLKDLKELKSLELKNEEIKNKGDEVLAKYGLEKPYLLYVGRLEKKKNTPALIEAMAILRENYPEIKEKLVLIGNASFGYDEVKFMIEEFDLERDILMPGWVEEDDMPAIFRSASAFVFPTKYEGFGIPVLQAMACGLPTALSDIKVLHEVAGDSALYFDSNNPCAIALAMKSLISEEALWLDLRKKGLERVKNFDFEKCARETLKVLMER